MNIQHVALGCPKQPKQAVALGQWAWPWQLRFAALAALLLHIFTLR